MKNLKIILVILAVEMAAVYLLAEMTHRGTNYCFPTNDWHWYAVQNEATSPGVVNCPLIMNIAPAPASNASINEHRALQALVVLMPLTLAACLVESFRLSK